MLGMAQASPFVTRAAITDGMSSQTEELDWI
jgi:hypothetical protein